MLKFLLRLLVDTFGLQRVNSALAEICCDDSLNAKTVEEFKHYDKLSEAYDKIEDDFFRSQ